MDPLLSLVQRSLVLDKPSRESSKNLKKSLHLPRGASFAQMLESKEPTDIINQSQSITTGSHIDDDHFEQALDKVFILGEALKKDYGLAGLAEYKKAVRYFLDIILKKAYQHIALKGSVNPKTMLQREYSLVYVVDQKLERLVKAVLSEQEETFAILEKVDEIKGLIIDYLR
ncbi:MAG: DUF327 family protein [Spirochaetia bacterium]